MPLPTKKFLKYKAKLIAKRRNNKQDNPKLNGKGSLDHWWYRLQRPKIPISTHRA